MREILMKGPSSTQDKLHWAEQTLLINEGMERLPLIPVARPEEIPLTIAQEHLWLLNKLKSRSATYLLPTALQLRGRLNVLCLEQGLEELIRRHEGLRTTFSEKAGQLVQVIQPASSYTLPIIDLQGLESEQREEEVQRLARQDALHPRDLEKGPLLRAYVVRLKTQEHVVLLTLHHIITDRWSNEVLVRELPVLYQTFLAGQPSPLAPLSIQYADYALWQRQWLQGEVLETYLAYWRKQLIDVPLLALPIDHPRSAVQTYQGATQLLQLSAALSEELRTLSQQEDVTLFMLLLAAFQVLLARYSGQDDIAVGTPIANRNHIEMEGVIGFFANILVLRTDLAGNPTFLEVLKRVREVVLGAYTYQDIPFEKVIKELEPERDLSCSPFFQAMFVLQNAPEELEGMAGVNIKPLEVESAMDKFDLTLSLVPIGHEIHCTLEYNAHLFEADTIIRLLNHWQTLLEGIVQNPQAHISDLPLLTESEQECLLTRWNTTQRDYPQHLCIHQLFEQQVERTPETIAVVFEQAALTYQGLNARANQLAHHLRSLGVGPEVLVGVCIERSLEMIVVLLGVLKAGGAYVPIDPAYPKERIAFMLQDSQVTILLTQAHLQAQLASTTLPIYCLDTNKVALDSWPTTNPENSVQPDNLAYVIYTSGSTGTPKGVLTTHRGVVNYLSYLIGIYHLDGGRVLQLTSFSFDPSVRDIFGSLLSNASVVLLAPTEAKEPLAIAKKARIYAITTILSIVPSMLRELQKVMAETNLSCPTLRIIMVNGEALHLSDLREVQSLFHEKAMIVNQYGPTECTMVSNYYPISDPANERKEQIPIGRPLSNRTVYILDTHGNLVPIGVAGELHIGGMMLTRGYLNHPELTAECFIPDPFSEELNARLYKTGDLARYLPDGNIEFLGRIDQQVKLRGYRIELGEIEVVLSQHPEVQMAVVMIRTDITPDQQLIAYVVGMGSGNIVPSARTLRTYLRARLPDYMIPSHFVMLEALPLTPNGKVDRRALPKPEMDQDAEGGVQGDVKTPIEELIASLWGEVLGRRQVGIDDNFFELGGHSLLATRLVARIKAMLAVEVPVRAVFESPTVARLAQQVEQVLRKGEGRQTPPLVPLVRPQDLPLSFAQQRLWFLDQLEPASTAYLLPSAQQFVGDLSIEVLESSLKELVQRHESLRTTFEQRAGQPVQVIHPLGHCALAVIDLQGLEQEQRDAQMRWLMRHEAQHPCDLAKGPLLRTSLLRLGAQEHVLLLTLHHIITDGWSNEVLMHELTTLYRTYVAGQPSPLAPLPIQYADYAFWQRKWLQGEVLEEQLAYWRKQLADVSALALPTDHPRPSLQTHQGATQSLQLSEAVSEGLIALSQQENVSLFMLLLAAFQVLLLRYTGQTDINIGTPIANRMRAETEGVIGFFVNTLVVRIDLSGNPTFQQVVRRVREVALSAYAHQDIPFEKVVEALEPERDLSYSPLFQVMFVLQHISREQGELAGMSIRSLAIESTTSKFDLTLSLIETKQGLLCTLEYNTNLFETETITRMLNHWQTLLQSIIQNPQAHVSNLPLLTDNEREQLLVKWNATQRDYPQDLCVHQLFEQQVQRTPEAVALVFEDKVLTYAQLNRRANQLAHHLQRLGIGPDELVGICMERSVEMVIGLLGVLKAGGAYVPLDPTYPAERLVWMLEEIQPIVVLIQTHLMPTLPIAHTQFICLDAYWERLSDELGTNPVSQVIPENLAYMIYTSGSTGKPKGAMNTHRGLCNRLCWMQDSYQLTSWDRVVQKTPFSFDVSVWEFFWPLLTGARLIVAIPGGHQDPTYLKALIVEQGVTTLHFVPSMLQAFLLESNLQDCGSLRQVVSSGEALSAELQTRFFATFPDGVQLHNLYGPTEAAIDVTFWECLHNSRGSSVPIGRPIANTQIYLLDPNLQPVPIGVSAEVFIGGVGLARGYFKQPELTAEKFIPNPFSQQAGASLYRTGDLAYYRVDGSIEFLGRKDHQVKLRGYRIELGEIEAVLGQHPAIQECVVLVREDRPGEKRLVAYLVLCQEQRLAISDVRSYLQDRLPLYMIPPAFISLDALPLTLNGKVDRQALPIPDHVRPDLEEALVLPRTPTEEVLAGIWSSILGIEQVGISDNFFALGGDSIRSIQVLSRARERGIHFSLRQLFQHQTIYELVQALGTEAHSTPVAEQVQPFSLISPQDRQRLPAYVEDAYPLTMLQAGMVFHSQYDPNSAIYHDIFSYHLQVSLDLQILLDSILQLATYHPIMRTSFDLSTFSEPLQLVHQAVDIALQVEDLSQFSPSEQDEMLAAWLEADKSHPFDWTRAPLLRFQLHLRSEKSFQFTLSFHHAILDGWSVASLFTELFTVYLSLPKGDDASSEPSPAMQFRDFVALERKFMALEEAKQYWIQKLSESTSALLPRWASPKQPADSRSVYVLPVPISQEISERLKRLAQDISVPIKSVLLAAHLRVLSLLSGQADVLTGLVSNGRPETIDGERILGLFLNTLPFRLKLSGVTWIELIQETFAAEYELLPYRWYPLAEIQRYQGGHTLFETVFNFVHFHVYQNLLNAGKHSNEFQILGRKVFEETNFTLAATFSLNPISFQVDLSLRCNTTELSFEQIEAIGGYYARVLAALTSEPHGRYELQSPLSAKEQEQLLVKWNATQRDYPRDLCVHQIFEQQVQRTPEAVALVFEDQAITYAQLNCQANKLAHHLQACGIGPEKLVGLCMERSLEMVVGLLGVLKAGGAYVPLDPALPAERLAFMLADARVSVLVTQQSLVARLPEHNVHIIRMDTDGSTIAQMNEENVMSGVKSENLVYVIYTSGSTGRPKGVAVSHQNLTNLVAWHCQTFHLPLTDRTTQLAGIGFDASAWEIWPSLLAGTSLHLPTEATRMKPEMLRDWLVSEAITLTFLPTPLAEQMLALAWPSSIPLRTVLTGGDRLHYAPPAGLPFSLVNNYGPTESTVVTTSGVVTPQATERSVHSSPNPAIGRPIANTHVYLLDQHLQLVPIGVPGELYISGAGLARGYLHRPELTAERFMPDPWSEEPGARLYQTGDLVRYCLDGELEYLGRMDQQVKIRGYRVELGEIEATLMSDPGVREAVVLAREDTPGEKRLVAYVVAEATSPMNELRRSLQEKLPDYMVPAFFVPLEALPLTANGKVDRRALPAPEEVEDREHEAQQGARTPVEELLVGVWCEVLGRTQVGVYEQFFEIGGHSLLAVRLIAQVRTMLGVEVPLRALFEAPTVAELAQRVEQELLKVE